MLDPKYAALEQRLLDTAGITLREAVRRLPRGSAMRVNFTLAYGTVDQVVTFLLIKTP